MLMKKWLPISGMLILLLCSSTDVSAWNENSPVNETRNIYSSPHDIRPLSVGEVVPKLTFNIFGGGPLDLNETLNEKPTILIFYRGGWCPFCNIHLGKLQEIMPALSKLGYQIIAISPDRPSKMLQSLKGIRPKYMLLSDSKMTGAQAFGICFRVDDKTIEKYKGYGINLDDASGEGHHLLPVPSAFIIGQDGIIKFTYVNPDYKVRIGTEELLAAAKSALSKKSGKK